MSTQVSKYDVDASLFSTFVQEAIKKTLSAIPCYVPMDAIQAEKEAWGDILELDHMSAAIASLDKHYVFYVDVDGLTPDTVIHGRLSGQFVELGSVAQYHELIRKIKQEKLKAIVAP